MSERLDGAASRAFAVTYLWIEAAAVVAYWLALWRLPQARSAFVLSGAPEGSLWSLLPAEMGLIVAAVVSAVGVHRGLLWAGQALWLHAGLALYASLLAVGMMAAEPRLWPGAGLMLPVLVVPLSLARSYSVQPCVGGESTGRWGCVMRTGVQTVLFWLFFLLIVPVLLARAETTMGWTTPWLAHKPIGYAGMGLFALAGAFGLWSGWTLAVVGLGTPLPLDPARRLVAIGPYRWVRNPMALSGVFQGVGVGLWSGSWLVVAYSLCGAVLWHVVVRPQEESELMERFGPDYQAYRRAVRCWVPRLMRA